MPRPFFFPKKTFWLVVICIPSLVAMGCRDPEAVETSPSKAHLGGSDGLQPNLNIDLGVIFVDDTVYHCFPFEQLRIDDSASVELLVSSCDCVRPSLVRYLDGAGESKFAIRLDFGVANTEYDLSRSHSLSVSTSIGFANGSQRSFVVNFVHSPSVSRSGGVQ